MQLRQQLSPFGVSVPSRGYLYLYEMPVFKSFLRESFPSPLGIIYISTRNRALLSPNDQRSFRPLSGLSISLPLFVLVVLMSTTVSVPSRGYLYLYLEPWKK